MPTLTIELRKQVVAPQLTHPLVQRVWRAVQRQVTVPQRWQQVSVVVVGDTAMKRLNQRYRHSATVTDVLSFPYGADGGEVVVCYPQAKRQAASKQVSVRSELAWLLTHGLLHILGYDHELAKDANVMRPLEQRILQYV
ncbi:MAG: rRNA maturation RNase YbeY [Candidatus Kerfeldbacteria bacterium]|nr:rRNA maturation RNase YbeY [Candidatus Kerfeldbacteria bacterium]